ncbi:uncharacterized protein LOC133873657 [Alnus glutinosa]|uniref:uncharacterized protein LOC133873657 n=1 Tax=Alnus glutinosa TaxID=3517 RepID=UPI002D78D527|nr:uncharacterized protein LOC133873657 [Alnus glutinosa]
MEESTMPGRCLTRSPLDESSHCPPTIDSSPYDIVFRMPIGNEGRKISRWYAIKVLADCPLQVDSEEIFPFWEGELPDASSFAAIAPHLYCIGGRRYLDPDSRETDAYKLDVTRPSKEWIPVMSMNSPRFLCNILVADGKLHVLAGDSSIYSCSNGLELEVFDPLTQKWEEVPDDPPVPLQSQFISAVLEDPTRIVVATQTGPCNRISDTIPSTFYAYDVRCRSWEKFAERELDTRCPLGHLGITVTAGNALYWLTEPTELLSYNISQDLWLEGNLKGLGISFLDGYDDPPFPGFGHLENQKFYLLQCVSIHEIECVTVHVEPTQKELVISVVAIRKYVTNLPSLVSDCLSLGKHEVQISEEASQESKNKRMKYNEEREDFDDSIMHD